MVTLAAAPPFPVFTHPMFLSLLFICCNLALAQAQITVYGQIPLGLESLTPTATPAAYNNTILVPPPIPSPAPANAFTLSLQQSSTAVNGLSIPHVGGSFWGFSIEMSVISQVRKSNPLLDLFYLFFLNHFFVLVGRNSYVQVDLLQSSKTSYTML